ncbi:hypothetical protein AX15_001740 [Amanita polypyramis BW_CC]|nr:hypothetical protein AX15_001740 [Amanita polypyramis BW_CC]
MTTNWSEYQNHLVVVQRGYYVRSTSWRGLLQTLLLISNNKACALSLLLYDYFLTLEDEVELVWAKATVDNSNLFVPLDQIQWDHTLSCNFLKHHKRVESTTCFSWYMIEGWLGALNAWAVELILILRLYALYNRSRRMVALIGCVFAVKAMIILSICIFATLVIEVDGRMLNGVTYCEVKKLPRLGNVSLGGVYWTLLALFEAFVLVLTIRRGHKYFHGWNEAAIQLTNMISILLRDSVSYTILIGLVYISNVILDLIDMENNLDTLNGLGYALPILMSGRMMLNVRRSFFDDQYRRIPISPSRISLHIDESPSPDPWVYII